MSIVTLAAAKLHLRIEGGNEDALIQVLVNASELSAAKFMARNVYADQGALDAAVAGVAAALASASAAYEAATTAADLIMNAVERAFALVAAEDAYTNAQTLARMTQAGIVINDAIVSAVLLTVGHLYLNREGVVDRALVELPMGVQYLLQPFKAY
jgi:hypothetical protein